jgi:hypothetical protein
MLNCNKTVPKKMNNVTITELWSTKTSLIKVGCPQGRNSMQGWKKPGFLKKKPAQWVFLFFFGFFGFFGVFLGFFAQTRGFLGFYPVS